MKSDEVFEACENMVMREARDLLLVVIAKFSPLENLMWPVAT